MLSDAITVATQGASRRLPAIFGALAGPGSDVQETTLSVPSLVATRFYDVVGEVRSYAEIEAALRASRARG